MGNSLSQRTLRFHCEIDSDGKTILHPLTARDQVEIQQALANPKGITFRPTIEDSQVCPDEPDVPWGLSSCGLDAESDELRARIRGIAREEWRAGNRQLAQQLLDKLIEIYEEASPESKN